MKRVVLVLIAIAALISCENPEVPEDPPEEPTQQEIDEANARGFIDDAFDLVRAGSLPQFHTGYMAWQLLEQEYEDKGSFYAVSRTYHGTTADGDQIVMFQFYFYGNPEDLFVKFSYKNPVDVTQWRLVEILEKFWT